MVPTLLILLVVTACSSGIPWQDTIDEALALSEQDGRPVILYFTFHG